MAKWDKIWEKTDRDIRANRPMVHHITNYVVMNVTANVTLSMGASPVMAHDTREVEELVNFASALVINIGTLSPHWVEAMVKAGKKAREKGIPIILDPVGAGATKLRTDVSMRILTEVGPGIIRGNQAEVATLAGGTARIQGVDSLETGAAPIDLYRELAVKTNSVVCVTGEVDWVTDGKRTFSVHNGHPMMSNVTGTGCSSSTAVAVFSTSGLPRVESCTLGLSVFGACGEVAAENSSGPGGFQVALIDALYNAPSLGLGSRLKITEV
ncbi:MAG TPA: hydroxyethylthiazole kinase [Proteobacteria bacterium]|nr:hydroxyethylthiazole kinase [bacterium BMS3Abin14]HDL52796.1 hydroxyethylthiazole kinase [Pseudomonadota bacterium]